MRLLPALVASAALAGALFSPIAARVSNVALSAGMPSLAEALLRPAAAMGQSEAMNDLGVLHFRNLSEGGDPARAAALLGSASSAGLPAAKLNLLLAADPRCSSSPRQRALFDAFEQIALAGEVRGASFAADCIGSDRLNMGWAEDFGTWGERFLKLAQIGGPAGDGHEKVKFAWLLLAAAEKPRPSVPSAKADRATRTRMVVLAAELFLAALPEKPAAYYGLSTVRDRQMDRLRGTPAFDALMAKSAQEWLVAGADAGHMVSMCAYSLDLAKRWLADRSDETLQRLRTSGRAIDGCMLSVRNPRDVAFMQEGGKPVARPLGYDFTVERWHERSPWLVGSPSYEDYDWDAVLHSSAFTALKQVESELRAARNRAGS